MAKLKDLAKQFEQELDGFFTEKAGRAVDQDEVEALKRHFKAEHLPTGQEAIVMAKQSKLLRPRHKYNKDLNRWDVQGTVKDSKELQQLLIKARLAHYGEYGGFMFYWIPRNRHTWADVLALDPAVVKDAFDIPESADPAQTVATMCEKLVARAFDYEFSTKKLEERVEQYRAMLRKRGYHAVLDAADKPGVTLSDLKASADKALAPARPNMAELDAWDETHRDRLLEGADHEQAVEAADATVREKQLGGLDL
jgi:hypothetical protein